MLDRILNIPHPLIRGYHHSFHVYDRAASRYDGLVLRGFWETHRAAHRGCEWLNLCSVHSPGLILLPIIAGSYGQAGLALVVAKMYRQIDEQLVSPQPSWMIVVNYVSGGALRGVLVGVVAGAITLIFTHTFVEHALMTIAVLLLVSLVSSLAGFMNGVFAKSFEQVTWVSSFVLTPLIYLSGVFYSVSMLPPLAQRLSLIDPIFYMVNLFRYSILGVSDGYLGVSVFVILFAAFAMFAVAVGFIARGHGIRD